MTTVPSSWRVRAALAALIVLVVACVSPPRAAAQVEAADTDETFDGPAPAPRPFPRTPEVLKLRLKEVEYERAHTSNLLPWSTVALGASAVLVSSLAGTLHAIRCKDAVCNTPNWVALVVVAGTVIGTLGAVWVIVTDADIRELDSRRYQLQEELNRFQTSWQRYTPPSQAGPALSLSFRL